MNNLLRTFSFKKNRLALSCLFALSMFIGCEPGSLQSSSKEVTSLESTRLPSSTPAMIETQESLTATHTFYPTPTAIITPTPIITEISAVGAVQYVVRGRDSYDKAASILTKFLDKNFATIAEYHDIQGFLSLSVDGAYLREIGYDASKGFTVTEINLYTLQRNEWVALGIELSPRMETYDYKLSPTKEWIAYKKMSTEDRFAPWDAEVQDVMLLKVDLIIPQTPVQLTRFGHAWPAFLSWSPDGRYLAFTDLDKLERTQIYLFDVETQQKIQVSRFLEPGTTTMKIGTFSWSPDGKHLAFVRGIYTDEQVKIDENQRIGLVSLSDFTTHWLNISGFRYLYNNKRIIWDSTGMQFVLLANDFVNTPKDSQSLIWVNPGRGTWETATISGITASFSDPRSLQICDPFLLQDNMTGLVVEGALAIHNREDFTYNLHSLAPMWACADLWVVPEH